MIDYSPRNIRAWSMLGPSGAVGESATYLGETRNGVIFCTADLCTFSGLDRFNRKYPDKLLNYGIAEQNMIGAAGGLAKEGVIPFCTTYASFASSRCLDQVRVNMSYMKLPIKLIGLTAGFGAGILGATHMSVEDLAIMRALPNITVLSPADCSEIIKCIIAAANTDDPTYIRLTGPVNTPVIYKGDYSFEIGRAITLKRGEDVCIIGTGCILSECLKVANTLDAEGITCTVVNMHTIKPIDEDIIKKSASNHMLIVTVEEHNIIGGLGSAVLEVLARNDISSAIEVIGINDFFPLAGDYEYQLEQSKLTAPQMHSRIKQRFESIRRNRND